VKKGTTLSITKGPRGVGHDDNEEDKKYFVGCGDIYSLATNMTVGMITQPVQSLRGSNVHEKKQ